MENQELERRILTQLGSQPMGWADLAETLEEDPTEVLQVLLTLEKEERVVQVPVASAYWVVE